MQAELWWLQAGKCLVEATEHQRVQILELKGTFPRRRCSDLAKLKSAGAGGDVESAEVAMVPRGDVPAPQL
jgi:hypothetical protein